MQYKVGIALVIIVFTALLPILFWEKTRRTASFVGISYLLFIYLYQDFVLGKIAASHDTYWGYTYFYSLARQWVVSGVAFGWNPYIGGGQPLALLSNYLLHSPVFIFAKLFSFLEWNFSYEQFFSLLWVFNHLWICTGVYLLLYLLLDSFISSLFGMLTLLLGGFFQAELASPNGYYVLVFLPYLLFFIILFWKHEKWGGMYLFAALLGLAVNYNNPAYIFIYLLVLLLSYLLVNIRSIKSIIGSFFAFIKEKPYRCIIAAILFIVPALPFMYSYFEMGDYVSPTRGFTVRGQTVSNAGFQPPVVAPLESYKVLYNWDINDFFLNTHTSFYIGLLPFIMLFVAMFFLIKFAEFRKKSGVFALSAVFLALIGAGNSSPVPIWSLLENLPLFNMVRHTFPFAIGATFFLILISSETLLQLFKTTNFSWLNFKAKISVQYFALFFLFALHLGSLGYFSNMRIHNLPVNSDTVAPKEKIHLKEFRYPSEWSLDGKKSPPIPYDLTGIIQKESILTNPDPQFNFMLHKDFIPFVHNVSREDYHNGFFVRPPEYQLYKKDLLLPTVVGSETAALYTNLGFIKKNTYSPIYATVESNSTENTAKNFYKTIDGDFNTYWQIDKAKKKDSFTWLSITFPSEIKIYGIRITPYKIGELWSSDRAKIQISRDGKKWEPLQKLDLRGALVNSSNASLLFPFKTAVTARFFRLWVDDKKFSSLTEIELIDEPIRAAHIILPFQKMDILNISNAVVKASSRYLAHTEDLAFDGNINTFWHVNVPSEDSQWISVKFPVSQTFNAVQFVPRQDESQMWDSFRQMDSKVELQVSEDGEEWTSIPQKRSAYNKAFLLSLGKMVTTKHARFLIHDKSRKFLSVAEIQIVRLPEGFFEGASFPSAEVGTVEPLESNNPNKIYLKVHAEKDANLIRLENYDRGWKVYIDKKESAIQKFGPNLQLIPIPSGLHDVYLEFSSWYDAIAWVHVYFYLFTFFGLIIYLARDTDCIYLKDKNSLF